ncbi:MAG TPA: universal stress protein [Actinomycetota bacterium]
MYKKVLLTTDGSPTASNAVRVGSALARASGAEILLLHVGDPAEGKKALETTSGQIEGDVSALSVEGDPADKILEVAENEGVDLIVVGNKGMTGARRFLLGSVPNQVSHNASCDVFIVKTT